MIVDHCTKQDLDREDAIEEARAMWNTGGVVFDTETTGLGSDAEIVEIAVVDLEGRVLLDSLVKPTQPVPPDAIAIHGISNDDLAGAPTMPEVLPDLVRVFAGRHVMAYNFEFDSRLLRQSASRHRLPWPLPLELLEIPGHVPHCIMKAFAKYYGQFSLHYGSYTWLKLSKATNVCGVVVPGKAHSALADALASVGVLKHMGRMGAACNDPVVAAL